MTIFLLVLSFIFSSNFVISSAESFFQYVTGVEGTKMWHYGAFKVFIKSKSRWRNIWIRAYYLPGTGIVKILDD